MPRSTRSPLAVLTLCAVLLAAGCAAPGNADAGIEAVTVDTDTRVVAWVEGCSNVEARTVAVDVAVEGTGADGSVVARLAGVSARVPVNGTGTGTDGRARVRLFHNPLGRDDYRLPGGNRTLRIELVRNNVTLATARRTVELDALNENRTCIEPWPPRPNGTTTRVPA